MTSRRPTAAWLGVVLLGAGVGFASLLIGPASMSAGEAWDALWGGGDASAVRIVRGVRMPRLLVGFGVGMALSVAGVLFQGLLRNALAEPYLLGVGPGALLGVTVAALLGGVAGSGSMPGPLVRGAFAFVGAVGVGALIFSFARRRLRMPTASVLLAGIAVGAFVHAIATLLLHVAVYDWHLVVRWTLGDLSLASYTDALLLFAVTLPGLGIAWWRGRALDVLTLGDEAAWYSGVSVRRTLWLLGGLACVIAAASVSVCGLVGFVGLVVPHLARAVVGPSHRRLLPFAALLGGALLVVADTVARTAFAPEEVPLGVVTAVFGAPFLAWALLRSDAA